MAACPSCGRESPVGSPVCSRCGTPLGDLDRTHIRKTATILFCDLVGSTELAERLDPESMRLLMSRYFAVMRAVIERHGGMVEKFIGDAVMAVFGVPVVHEDDALRGVRAAAEMRSALASLNLELARDRGVTIGCRIGVNSGEVVAGGLAVEVPATGDPGTAQALVTGDAVNVAARLEQAAAPGQVLLGAQTLRLAGDAVTAEPVDPLPLKGKAEPVPAFALVDVSPRPAGRLPRRVAPLVGRAEELGALREAFDRAVGSDRCLRVTVLGAPGVGKSSLADAFLTSLGEGPTVGSGRCLSYGDGITYWPVIEILTGLSRLREDDGPDVARARLARLLDGTSDAGVVAERLAELLGISGSAAAAEETHWAVRRLFEAVAARGPLVAVFEDVHWAEPALLDLLEHVTELATDAPILLLCTARPELAEVRPAWAEPRPAAFPLRLEALSPAEADELIANLVGSPALPEGARSVVGSAEGNPLFLEQLVGMLVDEGHLRRDGGGWVVTGDLGSLAIPSTIRGILEARLERLPTTERDVLERGSVEGREFHHGSLSAGGAGETEGALASLVDRGLIEPAVPTLGGGEAFRFRHALIRDAAYARLSKSTRSELHERHARWLGTAAGARLVEHEEVVAYHLEQATKLRADLGPLDPHGRDLAEEAAERLAASGRRAAGRGDVRAAANLLERALALLGDADERGPILVRLAEVCGEIGAYPRAETAFEEALAIAARTSDVRLDTHARLGRGLVRLQHDPEGVGAELRRFASSRIPALEAEGDDLGLARAWKCLAELALMDAQTGEMSAAYERVGLHAERAGDRAALADALGWLSLALMWDRTPPSEAIDRARRLRERLPDDRIVAAMTTTSEGYCLAMTGRIDEGRRRYQEGQRVFRELGLLRRAAGMQDQASRIELMAGDLGEAERQLREGYDTLAAVGERGYLSTQAALLGRLRLERGDLREAEELAGIAEAAGASDDLASAILWQGLRARLLARARDPAAAVELAEANVATAERTDGWDLRADAFTDLADVYRVLGRPRDAARALRAALGVVQEKGVAPLSERIRAELEGLERAAR